MNEGWGMLQVKDPTANKKDEKKAAVERVWGGSLRGRFSKPTKEVEKIQG